MPEVHSLTELFLLLIPEKLENANESKQFNLLTQLKVTRGRKEGREEGGGKNLRNH